jgi:signal transduction histidine kinase
VLFCNRAAGLLLKLDPSVIVGKSADDVAAEFVPALWKIREALRIWAAAPARPNNRLSFDVAATDDNPRAIAVDLFPVGDDTTMPTGLALLVRDVTSSTLLTALREREKVAMDLHDGIIQSLYALALGLSAKERLAQKHRNGQVRQELHFALKRVDRVIADIRQYIARLRLNQTDSRGLEDQLLTVAADFEEHGLPCPQILVDPGISALLGVDARAHVLQIVREATSNAIRHAGATSVTVSFLWRGDEAVLTVIDDGGGFNSADVHDRTGQGVRNMEERARAIGGSLSISSTPGRGTEVRIEVPMSSGKLAG